jgi:hypothetical protein
MFNIGTIGSPIKSDLRTSTIEYPSGTRTEFSEKMIDSLESINTPSISNARTSE